MRIIYLHQYFNTPVMAGGTRSYEIARRLVRMGHSVSVITSVRSGRPGRAWYRTSEEGIDVHWFPVPYSNHMSYKNRILAFLRFAYESSIRAASLDADLIFASSTPLTIAIPGIFASKRLRIPMVFEVRDLWPEIPVSIGALRNPFLIWLARWLEKRAYFASECVVALSPGMRDGITLSGYDSTRIAVIPNASDNALFRIDSSRREEWRNSRSWLGQRPLITYPGTLGRINGAEYIIDVAKFLLEIAPDIRVLLIGDGVEKTTLISKAEALGVLERNVFFEDAVGKLDMPDVFAASDIISSFVIDVPQLFHNSANKVFDTFAAGKPLLINHGGWQSELINKYGCGIVTYKLSFRDAATLIASRVQDSVWLKQAGEASSRLGDDVFDRDFLTDKLESIMEASVNLDGRRASAIAPGLF